MADIKKIKTLGDVLELVEGAGFPPARLRDVKSAIKRIAEMAGVVPAKVAADAMALRATLAAIRPAAHGVTPKTWANLLSRFRAALRLAGIIDPMGQGSGMRDPAWAPLLQAIAEDKRLACGLACFSNWCAAQAVAPHQVDNSGVQRFHSWLESRTLCPKPRDVVRRVPNLWNEAVDKIPIWPNKRLSLLSFRPAPKRRQWHDLAESFRRDAEAYLAVRAEPDLFDERPNAPMRPLAESTLRQQKEHLRLAASILIESGIPAEEIRWLGDLILPDRFKVILRHYHEEADGKPNAFGISLAKTLIGVARFYIDLPADEFTRLKSIAAKLPTVPCELTPKNRSLLRRLESEKLRARLLFLPDQLQTEATQTLETGRLDFVKAQMAIAIDILLAIPLRAENLVSLNWGKHFNEPNGSKGCLLLHVPAAEMKSRLNDYIAEVPDHVARRLRWYRRHVLPQLDADPNGDLFVSRGGKIKNERTLPKQIKDTLAKRLGLVMTAHQFRHHAGTSYLKENPQDLETARQLLGHSWSKTTAIYVDTSSRLASAVYGKFLLEQREALKLKRKRPPVRKDNKRQEPPCGD